MSRLAVSTLVLAALAVSEAAACPLGREVDVEQPVLPWQRQAKHPLAHAKLSAPPKVALVTAVGDGAAVVRTLSKIHLRCGSGRGEATVRVQRGQATASVTGFDPVIAECVRSAIAETRFTRATDDAFVKVALELR